ncbi:MAG: radical SAM protein [Acidimicrobiia bacterium]|nr:radical SAM protein [Acidimicrobiia bacterium]
MIPDAGDASSRALPPHATVVDIELTSRCNASCTFCPRDQTPHHGLIDEDTFTMALRRAVDYRDAVQAFGVANPGYFHTAGGSMWLSFCGMGEPLLHPLVVSYVQRAAEAGLRPIITTNGALLHPEKAEQLMDAGLQSAIINVGEIDAQYEEVYGLPFERTRENVEAFLAAAEGRCFAVIALVDHRDDQSHASRMREYWASRGATAFMPFPLVNRAGSLAVEQQSEAWVGHRDLARKMLERSGSRTGCCVPFLYPFIGYDGHYYLCSSDWRKEVSLGTVFDRSLVDILDDKAAHVCSRTAICEGCTHDPANRLALSIARADVTDRVDVVARESSDMRTALDHYWGCVDAMRAAMPEPEHVAVRTHRKRLPVRS